VLDGGLPAWVAAGGDVETGKVSDCGSSSRTSSGTHGGEGVAVTAASWERLQGVSWTLDDVLHNIEATDAGKGVQLVDARAAGRFNGTAPEPRAGK
jgi:thiosulfate/3-mercaptopyruvate sulfurtransferase